MRKPSAFTAPATLIVAVIAALLACSAAPLHAQEVTVLDGITVIGSGVETRLLEAPAAVTQINHSEIRRKSNETVSEIVRDVPGVRLVDGDVPGTRRISIRGEASRRVLIMIDGQALTDHSTLGTPLLIDPETIERIEVVRGSSSVLYGSKAIGGVVNIITKEGGDRPLEGEVSTTYYSATQGYRASATLRGAHKGFDYRLTVGQSDHKERDTPNGKLANSDFSDDSASGHLGYTSGNHYLALKAKQYRLSAGSWVDPMLLERFESYTIDLPERDLRKIGLYYEGENLTEWLTNLKASLYHQTVDRIFINRFSQRLPSNALLSFENTSDDLLETSGASLKTELSLAEHHRTLLGIDFEQDSLGTEKSTSRSFPTSTTSTSSDDSAIDTLSLYAQDEWKLAPSVTAYLGARYYDVSAELTASSRSPIASNNDQRLLGSTGLVWTPVKHWSFRSTLAQGYTYPTLTQLFVTAAAGGNTTVGNPNLEPESGINFELGSRYEKGGLLFDVTLFLNRARNFIDRQVVRQGSSGNPGLITWVNVQRARTSGLELVLETALTPRLTGYIESALIRREFDFGDFKTTDSGTPLLSGRIGLRTPWHAGRWQGEIDGFVRAASSAETRDETGSLEEQSGGYGSLNIAIAAQQSRHFDLRLSLINLLDKQYRAAGEVPAAGRSIELTGRLVF